MHLKLKVTSVLMGLLLISCRVENKKNELKATLPSAENTMRGTWKLLIGTVIDKGDTTVTDYTKKMSFIKILNDTHFAFLQHDLNKGKDSAVFVAGGGTYSLKNNSYTEHLEYCSARNWEGNSFAFTVNFNNDTLIIRGTEKVEGAAVDRINFEKYIKLNN